MMRKRPLLKLLADSTPALSHHDTYFYRSDHHQIVDGIAIEFVPGGLYVWKFIFPLFDPFGPNFLYSKRLSAAFYGDTEAPEKIVSHIIQAPETIQLLAQNSSLTVEKFIDGILSRNEYSRHPHAQFIHAAALVISKQFNKANLALNTFMAHKNPKYEAGAISLQHCVKNHNGEECDYFSKIIKANKLKLNLNT